ncbi:hypothetical protein CLIB1444_10S00210 [[Candida] jaroonii]|uniref:Uncharacterized protein n=1 Tax=[Candida] jaroonii TaxID=467808 RepID=A0ACA9YBT3_9ASCO|nr:hypothetical protein CLIB1444_10S00210 [[Candida] jaroonii]
MNSHSIRRLGILSARNLHCGSILKKSHKGTFKSGDTKIDTDEITTENNPWSPTILDDIVKVRKPRSLVSEKLPSNYRLAYQPMYEAPSTKYVSLLKRITMGFSVLGIYGAKLLHDSNVEDIYLLTTILTFSLPYLGVHYKTKDYITRIFRLYDKTKPQTLENLVNDENLIMEKLSFTGTKTYNNLLKISDNESLTIIPESKGLMNLLSPYENWISTDKETGEKQKFYVVDDIGGMKMDRIWGIIEKNSNIDNGRYIESKQ